MLIALEPMSKDMMMKNVAGFHSLDLVDLMALAFARSATETGSSALRNAFGTRDFQKEELAMRGTVELSVDIQDTWCEPDIENGLGCDRRELILASGLRQQHARPRPATCMALLFAILFL